MAQSVAARVQEIGLRMAIGAQPGAVARLFLGQGLRVALLGVVLGLGISYAVTRAMESLLFGVGARDLLSFIVVPGILLGAAAVASWIPAWRASRLDPAEVLHWA
jgi:ABC-type lipoprotein release transport system permease subunit